METQEILDERIIRIADILEQIQKLNKMIAMHQEITNDAVMIYQYTSMRKAFMDELKDLLQALEIDVTELAA